MTDFYIIMNGLIDGSIEMSNPIIQGWLKKAAKKNQTSIKVQQEYYEGFIQDYKASPFKFYDRVKTTDGKFGKIVAGRASEHWTDKKDCEFYILLDGSPFCWLHTQKQLTKV